MTGDLPQPIYLYAMHRYDLVFYVRLVAGLRADTKDRFTFVLVVTRDVAQIEFAADFIRAHFRDCIVAPVGGIPNHSVYQLVLKSFRLRKWHAETFDSDSCFVITDKSSVVSRFFLKRAGRAILIQQLERIDRVSELDLGKTLIEGSKALFLGAYFALWYRNRESKFIRWVKLFGGDNVETVYQVVNEEGPGKFCLLPCATGGGGKIVFFGSRFLSWDYFSENEDARERLERLGKIIDYINSKFPRHTFFYVPHSLEEGQEFEFINKICGGRLVPVTDCFSSEHFLITNKDVDRTFSIGSTSSHSSFSMGFSSKVLYRMLDLPSSVTPTYDRIFSGFPREFFATQLGSLEEPCRRAPLKSSFPFEDYLQRVFLRDGSAARTEQV